eukprot:9086426-Alexandrium_andersonii.AAC.1
MASPCGGQAPVGGAGGHHRTSEHGEAHPRTRPPVQPPQSLLPPAALAKRGRDRDGVGWHLGCGLEGPH